MVLSITSRSQGVSPAFSVSAEGRPESCPMAHFCPVVGFVSFSLMKVETSTETAKVSPVREGGISRSAWE